MGQRAAGRKLTGRLNLVEGAMQVPEIGKLTCGGKLKIVLQFLHTEVEEASWEAC